MKQNGAVAAYQIIQIPPHPHPGLIQLKQAKDSGAISWQRKTRKGEEEVRKDEKKKTEMWQQVVKLHIS